LAERVTVLDAGTFIVVEAHQATLGDVFDTLATRLGITFSNTERVDLARSVDGRRLGTVLEVMRWLVPDHGFVLLYEERTSDDARTPRLERIGFLSSGRTATTNDIDARSSESVTAASGPARSVRLAPVGGDSAVVGSPAEEPELPNDGTKPEVPSTPMSEIKSVAEQLWAATPAAQLAIEREAHAPAGPEAPPEFLRPQSDVSQTTLQQQAERSQALAVEQLRVLMDAFKAALPKR
jgi:hypothetical protein